LCNIYLIMVYDKSKKIQNLINQFFIIIICFRCEEEDKTIETHQDPLLDPDIVEALDSSEPKVEGLAANQPKAGVFQMLDRLEEVTDDLLNR
jgi:hypothetical protein